MEAHNGHCMVDIAVSLALRVLAGQNTRLVEVPAVVRKGNIGCNGAIFQLLKDGLNDGGMITIGVSYLPDGVPRSPVSLLLVPLMPAALPEAVLVRVLVMGVRPILGRPVPVFIRGAGDAWVDVGGTVGALLLRKANRGRLMLDRVHGFEDCRASE